MTNKIHYHLTIVFKHAFLNTKTSVITYVAIALLEITTILNARFWHLISVYTVHTKHLLKLSTDYY